MGESQTFDASEDGFQVRLEISGTDARRGEQCLDVDNLTSMTAGALACQHVGDVSAAANEAVVRVHAPVESHATVARAVDRDNLVRGTLSVQLLLQTVIQR